MERFNPIEQFTRQKNERIASQEENTRVKIETLLDLYQGTLKDFLHHQRRNNYPSAHLVRINEKDFLQIPLFSIRTFSDGDQVYVNEPLSIFINSANEISYGYESSSDPSGVYGLTPSIQKPSWHRYPLEKFTMPTSFDEYTDSVGEGAAISLRRRNHYIRDGSDLLNWSAHMIYLMESFDELGPDGLSLKMAYWEDHIKQRLLKSL